MNRLAQIVALVCMLATTQVHAGGEKGLDVKLSKMGVNYITTDGIIYLMDDTDPLKICEIADRYPTADVNEVYNVKTLVNANCRKHQ